MSNRYKTMKTLASKWLWTWQRCGAASRRSERSSRRTTRARSSTRWSYCQKRSSSIWNSARTDLKSTWSMFSPSLLNFPGSASASTSKTFYQPCAALAPYCPSPNRFCVFISRLDLVKCTINERKVVLFDTSFIASVHLMHLVKFLSLKFWLLYDFPLT